jgi:mono/diheme cytochrome c family protein
MRAKGLARLAAAFCLLLAIGASAFTIAAWRPAIAPVLPPVASSFAPDLVRHGAELAAIGNCDVCHTAKGGREFAGGRAVPTPFGTIYSTNITSDPATGIGGWSEAAFARAMRFGVRRDGAYLYPAFPYDHFTLVSDADDEALYAFLMTRVPIHAAARPDKLPFPINIRLIMFGWNLLFLHAGPFRPDGAHDAMWNRGAYFVEGLGHCGACHTPRNAVGAEVASRKFAGSAVEGWTAYALDENSPAQVPWTADALAQYLGQGFEAVHGLAAGPMAEVANDLQSASAQDIRAIAAYVAEAMNHVAPESDRVVQLAEKQSHRGKSGRAASADSQAVALRSTDIKNDEGAVLYAGTCSGCHEGPRALPFGGVDLALSTAINGPNANNLVDIVMSGLPAAEAAHAPIMPGFANAMSDEQVAALARYLRARYSDRGPWTGIAKNVNEARNLQRVPTASLQGR